MQIKQTLTSYIDSGFPIIYINSFEEVKVDGIITSVMGGRKGYEWNGANGFCDYKTKAPLMENKSLKETLIQLCSDTDALNRRFLVIKDAHLYFDDPVVITCLKKLALLIADTLDASIVIVSSVLKFPKELEKFITIVEMEYPDQDEKNISNNLQQNRTFLYLIYYLRICLWHSRDLPNLK